MPAVVAEGLAKRFGDTEALCGVDFDVERGQILGVLGPNGAGKTTAVRILTTLLLPDAGRAEIDGIDVLREPSRARARIGLTGQYAAVDEMLTGFENLEHVGRLYHMGTAVARERASELLERFDLVDARDRVVKGYSGGMRRRLDIAMSLIARPSVLFLDEPTTGLDPRSRQSVWELIEQLVRGGTTTLLTTQYLDEADRLADDIVVIDRGKVIARGTSDQLKQQIGGELVEVIVDDPGDARRVIELLAHHACGDPHVGDDQRTVSLPVWRIEGLVPVVVRELDAAGVAVHDVGARRATLDDVFFALTGHAAEDESPDGETGEPSGNGAAAAGDGARAASGPDGDRALQEAEG
ncbi:MAG TPA: ATP-binding cassette domain-containing protein [Acidimicrobiales bacterium]|nr:ATP-binding cassette domain-containing protein [Acidimicrobiales bacterium]